MGVARNTALFFLSICLSTNVLAKECSLGFNQFYSIHPEVEDVFENPTHSRALPIDSAAEGPKKYIIAWQPGKAQAIHGIAIGILGHDVICNAPYNQTTNGMNLQLGAGLVHWYTLSTKFNAPKTSVFNTPKSITNGLQCSIFGTQTDRVNGVAVSGFVSVGERLNGVAFNLGCGYYELVNGVTFALRNSTGQTNGLQIGLINHSVELKGAQIGLWNRTTAPGNSFQIGIWNTINGKSFPLVNFSR